MPQENHHQRIARIFKIPLADSVISQINGNAPREAKELAVKWLAVFHASPNCFARSCSNRIKVTEVSISENTEFPTRMEGKVICEIDVREGSLSGHWRNEINDEVYMPDMVNEAGDLQEGCIVLLIDEYVSVVLGRISRVEQKRRGAKKVSFFQVLYIGCCCIESCPR